MDNAQSHPHRLRMTRQRRVVLDIVTGSQEHPTGDAVHRAARRRLPRISLGTVYRNLELLAEHGLVRRLEGVGRRRRYDGKPAPHYHARCLGCGRIADVWARAPQIAPRARAELSGWRLVEQRVELVGYCPRCASPGQGEPREAAEAERTEGGHPDA